MVLLQKVIIDFLVYDVLLFVLPIALYYECVGYKGQYLCRFFVLVSLSLIEMADRTSGFWDNRWNLVKFVLYVVLMCMFRNNGLYALILLIPICFFVLKREERQLLFCLCYQC